jgi:hypothetical protein
MPEAYKTASDNGSLPAHARQIMYAAHPDSTANWDVVFDARGHLAEPHTEMIVPLGILDVRWYVSKIKEQEKLVAKRIKQDPTQPWDTVVMDLATGGICKTTPVPAASEQAKSAATPGADFTKSAKRPDGARPHKRNGQVEFNAVVNELIGPEAGELFGISREFARLAQKVHAIPEATMNAYVEKMQRDEDGEISTEGLPAYAKKHKRPAERTP